MGRGTLEKPGEENYNPKHGESFFLYSTLASRLMYCGEKKTNHWCGMTGGEGKIAKKEAEGEEQGQGSKIQTPPHE